MTSARAVVRVLIPLLLAALLLGAAGSAEAQSSLPKLPTQGAVAKIYPVLRDGTVEIERESAVRYAGKGCDEDGRKVRGAVGREATYSSTPTWAPPAPGDDDLEADVVVERLPSARVARSYLRGGAAQLKRCLKQLGSAEKAPVHLGQQAVGYRFDMDLGIAGVHVFANLVYVRVGNLVVGASTTASAATPIGKTVRLARLALRTAR